MIKISACLSLQVTSIFILIEYISRFENKRVYEKLCNLSP